MAAIPINRIQFLQMIQHDKPVLVNFLSPWCTYCRRIAPAFHRIAEEYRDRLSAVTVSIDEEIQLAEAEEIEAIPTLVLYQSGRAIGSIVTPDSKAMIERFLQTTLP